MKVAIVGAGNIGSSLVHCLVPKGFRICISNPSVSKLEVLKSKYPSIEITTDNLATLKDASVIFLAVKPYHVETVLKQLAPSLRKDQILISVAAGIGTEKLSAMTQSSGSPVFYVIPNTALSKGESMSLYCCARADETQEGTVTEILSAMGSYQKVDEAGMDAYISLASCGIAYALRYVRAAMCGAVEMGIKPDMAQKVICQTLKGAVALLEDGDAHPESEIDKVTTPGGLTIKGLNAMEAGGFTTSVIEGLKAGRK